MKKFYKIMLSIALLFSLGNSVFALEHKESESTFDYISREVYCFFAGCENAGNVINNIEKEVKDTTYIIEEKKDKSIDEKKEKIIQREVVEKTKYINRGNTVVKKYYNTIERTPIVNNTYPTTVNETYVTEEYDDSSLKRKISNNRSLISQIAGLVDDDD
ncbi:MAG TPA: hypothetical protein EYG72_00445, partial [Candidatus Pacebacteria bacterium]|nr:hypothetical protein [Candidatus Paceibacterota bacterium]